MSLANLGVPEFAAVGLNAFEKSRWFPPAFFGLKATYSAVAVTFVLTLVITGFMVLSQPQNLFDGKEHVGVVGVTDVTKLENLWDQACNKGIGKFELSTGNSQIGPLLFKGPCKADRMEVTVIGDVIAIPKNIWPSNTDTWIKFQNVPNLHVIGQNGRFIGQGFDWWNACQRALAFHGCTWLVLDRVTSIDSPRNHISINACNGATISEINIQAPGIGAPNTDDIDISDTNVNGGHIGTGDDCIAINAGSSNINITNLNCGPGHGISVGSLGRNFAHEPVSNINVIGATFNNTQNGVRIKTVPGGSGSANQITIKSSEMINVQHPIIIIKSVIKQKSHLQWFK
ncbi:putative polygalacturonase At3g15720 [Bidens hawaiensis]|uniref:putative polygalacturonase At3g15720 n=1 Tax=Bidens hawaiensis TaxID=980011 RepID=UPI00404B3E8B